LVARHFKEHATSKTLFITGNIETRLAAPTIASPTRHRDDENVRNAPSAMLREDSDDFSLYQNVLAGCVDGQLCRLIVAGGSFGVARA
jgi:hypothetical protein